MLSPPGWNSIERASTYAKWFTYAGWISLFLLGIFEILAHIYGTRKDTLIVAQEQSVKKASDQQIQSLKAELEQKGNALQTEVDSFKAAQQKLGELEAQVAQRHLSSVSKEKLHEILITSPGHEVYVLNPQDKECQTYADDFAEVLSKANWKLLPNEFWMSTINREYQGFHIWVANYDNPACAFLQKALKDAAGIYADGGLAPPLRTHGHPEACVLYVGFK
jgi:hypothetical protein